MAKRVSKVQSPRMNNHEGGMKLTKSGLIQFKLVNIGSKSESEAPFLVIADEKQVRLYYKGDNPFSQDTLRKFEGKKCVVLGEYDEKKKRLLVTEISEVPSEPDKPEDKNSRDHA